jgi:DNA primase
VTSWNTLKGFIDVENLIDQLSIGPFTRAGDELTMSCPLPSHGGVDNNPSFSINESKKVYNCFICGGGDLADLVAKLKGVSRDNAKKLVRESTSFPSDPQSFIERVERIIYFTPDIQVKTDTPIYNEGLIYPWYLKACGGEGLDYFNRRGITGATIDKLWLGYDPEHHRKYKEKFTGEVRQHIGPAAIIPVYHEGYLVGWQERWIDPKPEGIPKYTNTDHLPRKSVVYNIGSITLSRTHFDAVIVVEAPLTAAYLESNGFVAVATFGTEANAEQIQQLRRLKRVLLWYDNDPGGKQGLVKMANALDSHVEVLVVPFVPGEKSDANDVLSEHLLEYVEAAKPWFTMQLEESINGVL